MRRVLTGTRADGSRAACSRLFVFFGVPMYYDGRVSRPQVDAIPCDTALSPGEVYRLTESLVLPRD